MRSMSPREGCGCSCKMGGTFGTASLAACSINAKERKFIDQHSACIHISASIARSLDGYLNSGSNAVTGEVPASLARQSNLSSNSKAISSSFCTLLHVVHCFCVLLFVCHLPYCYIAHGLVQT